MKKRPANEDSDEFDVDEPEEFQESGSDWDPDEDVSLQDQEGSKKRKSRGKAASQKKSRNSTSKKKKVEKPVSEEEEEEEEEEEDGEEEEEEEDSEEEAGGNGAFVVLKADFQAGGDPPLWKIDGKALLQKYVPFQQDGKTLYKNTSTYSGWTQSNRDQYTSAPVTYVQQGKKEIIIEFNRDKVKLDDKKEEDSKNETPAGETVDV